MNIRFDDEGKGLTTGWGNKLTDNQNLETANMNENILAYGFSVGKALIDLGASINLMPLSMCW